MESKCRFCAAPQGAEASAANSATTATFCFNCIKDSCRNCHKEEDGSMKNSYPVCINCYVTQKFELKLCFLCDISISHDEVKKYKKNMKNIPMCDPCREKRRLPGVAPSTRYMQLLYLFGRRNDSPDGQSDETKRSSDDVETGQDDGNAKEKSCVDPIVKRIAKRDYYSYFVNDDICDIFYGDNVSYVPRSNLFDPYQPNSFLDGQSIEDFCTNAIRKRKKKAEAPMSTGDGSSSGSVSEDTVDAPNAEGKKVSPIASDEGVGTEDSASGKDSATTDTDSDVEAAAKQVAEVDGQAEGANDQADRQADSADDHAEGADDQADSADDQANSADDEADGADDQDGHEYIDSEDSFDGFEEQNGEHHDLSSDVDYNDEIYDVLNENDHYIDINHNYQHNNNDL